MHSPLISVIAGEPSGKLKGKAAVRAYWAKALRMFAELHFELVAVLSGVNSVTLYYKGTQGMAAEVLHFNSRGRVHAAYAHYVALSQ